MERILSNNQTSPLVLSLVPVDTKTEEFNKLMLIYEKAMSQAKIEIETISDNLKQFYEYDVINNINCRMKSPDSILKKMKRKHYDLNYKALIENINDIVGIRIVCPFKSDIKKVRELLEKGSSIQILQEKDYLTIPKKSGYSGLHIIGQVNVDLGNVNANVKLEIQIRTMAMDFWATTEHKIKYKAEKKLSKIDSKKMIMYAKIIRQIDEKISKINSKYDET